MATPVLTFHSKVTDEYGAEFPQALLAVRAVAESSQTTMYSESLEGVYDMNSDLEAITYKVNYWYTDQTKAAGKRSRKLIRDENGSFTDEHTVDLDDPEVATILNGDSGHVEKVLQAIKADITRKFN